MTRRNSDAFGHAAASARNCGALAELVFGRILVKERLCMDAKPFDAAALRRCCC